MITTIRIILEIFLMGMFFENPSRSFLIKVVNSPNSKHAIINI